MRSVKQRPREQPRSLLLTSIVRRKTPSAQTERRLSSHVRAIDRTPAATRVETRLSDVERKLDLILEALKTAHAVTRVSTTSVFALARPYPPRPGARYIRGVGAMAFRTAIVAWIDRIHAAGRMVCDALGDRGDGRGAEGLWRGSMGNMSTSTRPIPRCPRRVRELLELGPEWQRRAWAALPAGVVRHDPANVTLLAPVPDARKIICIGLNYRDHAAESGVPVPTEPVLFSKYPTALIGHGAPIVLPA